MIEIHKTSDKTPFFTIGIPTFNRYQKLKIAINSVLSQSFENFELIISDNASTDDTRKVPEIYKDNRIKFIRNSENCGLFKNYLLCRSYSSGIYFAWLASDDYFNNSNYLLEAYKVIVNEPGIGLISSGRQLIDTKTNRIHQVVHGRNKKFENLDQWITNRRKDLVLNSSGVLMRSEYLTTDALGEDPGAGWGFDDLLYAKMVAKGKAFELENVSVTMAVNASDTAVSGFSPQAILNSMRNTKAQFIDLIVNSVDQPAQLNLINLIERQYSDDIMLRRFIKAEIFKETGSISEFFTQLSRSGIRKTGIFRNIRNFLGVIGIVLPKKVRTFLFRVLAE